MVTRRVQTASDQAVPNADGLENYPLALEVVLDDPHLQETSASKRDYRHSAPKPPTVKPIIPATRWSSWIWDPAKLRYYTFCRDIDGELVYGLVNEDGGFGAYRVRDDAAGSPISEASASDASQSPAEQSQCAVCFEKLGPESVIELECRNSHVYCRSCLSGTLIQPMGSKRC